MTLPPLALYVHLPWCLRKCPYCDFNSHAVKASGVPADEYVDALLKDLELELPLVWGRPISSVFFGGGTPSLFTAEQIDRLLGGVRSRLPLAPAAEITLEANPGASERDHFRGYREAGINRISLGAQSFDDELLKGIGRIHGVPEVERALDSISDAGIANFNIDLMFALPGQSSEQALKDVRRAIDSGAPHISHYQLTLEPNTAFHANPPVLPNDEQAWAMQQGVSEILQRAGYRQYEISAWSLPGYECAHNLNYWTYGDFIGIGAGGHGKLTLPAEERMVRRVRQKHPTAYLDTAGSEDVLIEQRELTEEDLVFEFFLNRLRLREGFSEEAFIQHTGVAWERVSDRVRQAVSRGLLAASGKGFRPTDLGWRFVNETQAIFLP